MLDDVCACISLRAKTRMLPNMMEEIFKDLFLFLSIAVLFSVSSCSSMLKKRQSVAAIDIGAGRVIVIKADIFSDSSQGYYYEVRVNGVIMVPEYFICASRGEKNHHFSVLSSSDGNLIGVIIDAQPNVVIAMHDFNSGRTWPGRSASESWEQNHNKGIVLLQDLQKDSPAGKLSLSELACD